MTYILKVVSEDRRFQLREGEGVDSVHNTGVYAYAVCRLVTDNQNLEGVGLTFTLGRGNELVCRAIEELAQLLVGMEIHELMADYGYIFEKISETPDYRWLGPRKGVVHLALASITNACFDLWAKVEDKPLWKLLLDLSPAQLLNTMNFRYIEDFLSKQEALDILKKEQTKRTDRVKILKRGYTGYDTSVGWFGYTDEIIVENAKKAYSEGFKAMKLKIGGKDWGKDVRRAFLVREAVGDETRIMLDANQQWTYDQAVDLCEKLEGMNPYFLEEPTDPDDIIAHKRLSERTNVKIATGEHVPNKTIFKNYFELRALSFCQIDALRVGGVAEYLLISLMAKKCGIPVLSHVGDMGQLHQHLVLADHIIIGHPADFLEHIPHLEQYFKYPAIIKNGVYIPPTEPGASCDFKS